MRKVYVDIVVSMIIEMDDGLEVYDILNEMDYNFTLDPGSKATIVDTQIKNYEVRDSK